MKRNAVLRIVIWSVVILVLLAIMCSVIFGIRGFRTFTTVASAELEIAETQVARLEPAGSEVSINAREVNQIEIEWVAGSIVIQPADTDQIIFFEDGSPSQDSPMVWRQRGDKLSISFSEDNKISFNFGITINTVLNKDLIIYVPRDWTCDSLEINAASASVEVTDLTIREVEFDGASGTCEFENCTVDTLDLDTASGDIWFTGSLESLDCDAASASVYLELDNTPRKMDMDTASGDLELTLPADTGFTVSMDGLSTDFHSDFETTVRNGNFLYGDGSCRIEVDAMSGDVTIHKAS